MAPLAVLLIIVSSFMHAAWNLAARRRGGERIFFGRMLGFIAIAGFLPALASEISAGSISSRAWMCVIGSGLFCGSYFYFLARSYESSDFTTAYPVARALPVLLVAAGDVLRGRFPSAGAAAGLLIVAGGCFLVPLTSFGGIKLKKYFNRASIFMLLTAAGTVGYSILDNMGQESVSPGAASAFRYGYFFFLFTFIIYACMPGTRRNSAEVNFRGPALAGVLGFTSYGLVLWAYQITELASYVVAFRQLSIIIGIVSGIIILKEKGAAVKLTGGLMLAGGLVLIALKG